MESGDGIVKCNLDIKLEVYEGTEMWLTFMSSGVLLEGYREISCDLVVCNTK